MDHAEVMNSCDAKAQRIGLARLTAVERVVVLVSCANFEIELGGLDSFYYNSAGDEAVPTAEGARQRSERFRQHRHCARPMLYFLAGRRLAIVKNGSRVWKLSANFPNTG